MVKTEILTPQQFTDVHNIYIKTAYLFVSNHTIKKMLKMANINNYYVLSHNDIVKLKLI